MTGERPVFIPSAAGTLFGVLSPRRTSDVAVVALPDATPGGLRGQNGVLVRLVRAITGYSCLRIDYHGIGESIVESTGALPRARRDEPFLDDLDAALAWLRHEGYRRFVVVGSCFGAQTALLAVPARPDICGVALLACLVAAPAGPPSQLVLEAVADAARRGVATLFCYGTKDGPYAEFRAARGLGLDAALAADCVELAVLDGTVHSFLDVDLQPLVIDTVAQWVERTAWTSR